MTGRNRKGGAAAPPASGAPDRPAQIDIEERWREFEAKTEEVAEAMRRALCLGPEIELASYAQRYAMAAMSGHPSEPWPPARPTEQALKGELLRIEKAAKAMLRGRKGSEKGLADAIKAISREGQRALPEALFILAELPNPAPERLERLARNAAAAARVIPLAGKHPGGGRPPHTRADAFSALLAQDFVALTQTQPSASNWDRSAPELFKTPRFVALVEAVLPIIGVGGVSRESAKRTVGRAKQSRSPTLKKKKTNKRT